MPYAPFPWIKLICVKSILLDADPPKKTTFFAKDGLSLNALFLLYLRPCVYQQQVNSSTFKPYVLQQLKSSIQNLSGNE